MSVCVIIETQEGKLKKSSFELATYAKSLADNLKTPAVAIVFNTTDAECLKNYGINKVYHIQDEKLNLLDSKVLSETFKQILNIQKFDCFVVGMDAQSKYIGAFLSVYLHAGYVNNVIELPTSLSPFTVKHSIFGGKAFGYSEFLSEHKVIGVMKNSIDVNLCTVNLEEVTLSLDLSDVKSGMSLESKEEHQKRVTISDADIVVSGGLGLKGAENWHLIEDLADLLGAAIACSKPVSDMGWRPYSEHVGQTGKPVSSNIYIAIGISGSVQHLAGINASKVKIVINKDSEAPFFKAADYGIVGDAFDVIPRLIKRIKEQIN